MKSFHPKPVLNYFTILTLLLTLLGSAVAVTPAYAAGITVNTTDDELNSDGDCSLREAIQAANSDAAVDACAAGSGADVITLPAGTYTLSLPPTGTWSEFTNLDGDLDIMGDLTLNGAAADTTIIQAGTLGYPDAGANGIDSVFQISTNAWDASSYTVSMNDVTIRNGRSLGDRVGSGVMMLKSSNLTLTNVVITGNDSSANGGGIFAWGGTLSIDNSSFSNNRSMWGGATYIQGSGDTPVVTITDSSFVGNIATNINGGGALSISGIATITNSTFANNKALVHSGGGIYYTGSNLTLRNNTFSGNSALFGGALHVQGTAHLYNNILADSVSVSNPNVSIPDCHNYGTIDGSHNLIEQDYPSGDACGTGTTNLITGQDPRLGSLSATAPFVFTPQPASVAVEGGNVDYCPLTDQVGTGRPQGPDCDMGSIEIVLVPGISILESGGSTDVIEGLTTDTYSILLNAPPAANVTINITPDIELTAIPSTMTFTPSNWHTPQTVTVSGVADGVAENPDSGNITHSITTTDPVYAGLSLLPAVNVNITERTLTPNPASLDFGSVPVWNAGTPQQVIITNSGTASVTLGTISFTGNFYLGSALNTCSGNTLNPGESCNFTVGFTPQATGTRTGEASIPSNAYGSPLLISLTGVGAVPLVGLSTNSIDFGDVLPGTAPIQTVTVTNIGGANLYVTSTSATSDFYWWGGTCNYTWLTPGQTCTVDVTFLPQTAGPQTGTLYIDSNAASSPDTVALSGNSLMPDISLSVPSLDFGDQLLGTTSPAQTVILTNSGTAPLHIGTLTVTGNFALAANTCDNLEIPVQGNCTFSITFTPAVLGLRTGKVNIPSDAGMMQTDNLSPAAGARSVFYYVFDILPLTGRGVSSQNPYMVFTSNGSTDGTVRESRRDSKVGGFIEPTSELISVGDDYLNRQYVGILDFDTSSFPPNAVITSVKLRVKSMILISTAYARLGDLTADIVTPFFGAFPGLESQDFQWPALARNIGTFTRAPTFYKWITLNANPGTFELINRTGHTQFRLRFPRKYSADGIKQQLRFLSGDFSNPDDRPQLLIYYYLP